MKKLISSLMIVVLLAAIPATAFAGYTISPKLLAGQTEFAGVVKITGDADFLTLRFELRGGEAGGELAHRAQRDGIPLVVIPPGLPPRAALGYSFVIPLTILERMGLIGNQESLIQGTIERLESLSRDGRICSHSESG